MPKGVEHIKKINGEELFSPAFPSVMPKGVEHKIVFASWPLTLKAFPSVMPKGVEHVWTRNVGRPCWNLSAFPSVMPKGVEHIRNNGPSHADISVSICDAERR